MSCQEEQVPGAWLLAVGTEQLLPVGLCGPQAVAGEGVVWVMVPALADVAEAAAEGAVLVGMDGGVVVVVVLGGSATDLTSQNILQAASRSYIFEAAKEAVCRNGCWAAETAATSGLQHCWHSLQERLLGLPEQALWHSANAMACVASQASAQKLKFSHLIW